MLDHVTLETSNVTSSLKFYAASLAPLKIAQLYHDGTTAFGFGTAPRAFFWISQYHEPITGTHVAFQAFSRTAVDEFHAAAIAAGGTDNGKPGLRPHYDDNYYSAFVLDPDGHNIEAVCRLPAP